MSRNSSEDLCRASVIEKKRKKKVEQELSVETWSLHVPDPLMATEGERQFAESDVSNHELM